MGSLFSRLGLELARVLVAREFGPASYGAFSAAFALVTMFIIHADLGMSQYMIATASPDRTRIPRCLGNTVLVFLIVSLLLCPLMVALGLALGYDRAELLLVASLSLYAIGLAGERIALAVLQILARTGIAGHIKSARALLLLALIHPSASSFPIPSATSPS